MAFVRTYFSPFYDFARRKLKVGPEIVDHCLEGGGAEIDGRNITLQDANGVKYRTFIGLFHRRHATRWVDEFNVRAVRTVSY